MAIVIKKKLAGSKPATPNAAAVNTGTGKHAAKDAIGPQTAKVAMAEQETVAAVPEKMESSPTSTPHVAEDIEARSARMLKERRLTRTEAAEFLTQCGYPISAAQLAKYAITKKAETTEGKSKKADQVVKKGPPFKMWANKAMYERGALLDWAEAQ